MGGKSKTPPPNPELTAMQISTMKQQQEILAEQLALQKEMQPLQMETLQFGLESQKTAFQQSQEDRTYALKKRDAYDTALKPLLDKATGFNEDTRRAELAKESDRDINDTFDDAAVQQARTLGRAGISVDAMKTDATQRQAAMAEATARAGTGHAISAQAKQEGLQAKTDALNLLAGYPAAASNLTTTGASISANRVSGFNAGMGGIYSGMSASSKIFGDIGQSAANLWGKQAEAKYKADSAAASQKSQMIGAAAGMAMMVMSDRRLKENIVRIGTTAKGFPLYKFNFKGNSELKVGVMADEVEQVLPDAVMQVGGYKAVDYSRV